MGNTSNNRQISPVILFTLVSMAKIDDVRSKIRPLTFEAATMWPESRVDALDLVRRLIRQ